MTAIATACFALAIGCLAALAVRWTGFSGRAPLLGALLPVIAASLAAGATAWIAASLAGHKPSVASPGSELEVIAVELRRKLGMAGPEAPQQAVARPAGDLRDLARGLAEKLKRDPGNGDGWALLARSYMNIQQFGDAEAAFEKAASLLPPDAALLADWADARVMARDGKWDSQARRLVERALTTDPANPKALALSAAAKGAAAQSRSTGKSEAAAPAAGISGRIVLDAKVKAASPDAVVFVFAKDPNGGGPPLAVKRLSARGLPTAFELDDGDTMVAGRNLSAYREVLVSARLSNSGNAMPQSGDIDSNTVRAKLGARGIELRIGGAQGRK